MYLRIFLRILLLVAVLFSHGHADQEDLADSLMMDYDMYDDPYSSFNVMEGDIFVEDNDEVLGAGTTTDEKR